MQSEYSAPEIPDDYWMAKQRDYWKKKHHEITSQLEQQIYAQKQQFQGAERDPSGLKPSQPGAKLDAGKQRPGLVLGGFSRALAAVTEIGTFGANKYSDNGWMSVPDGQRRYEDAGLRHKLARLRGEQRDPESNYLHLAHEAWNILAVLELVLRERENGRTAGTIKGA